MELTQIKRFVRYLIIFNSVTLMLSGPAGSYGDIKLFQSPIAYTVDSTILLNDVTSEDKEVGYKIKSQLSVDPIWSDSDSHFILKFKVESPKLNVRSRTAPHEGFTEHASLLDYYKNSPFFVEWKDGIVQNVYINANNEEPTWVNYKKGLLSVFQFQIMDQDTQETDISGRCDISYETVSLTVIRKVKHNCSHPDIKQAKSNNVLSTLNNVMRLTRYQFTEDLKALEHIYAEELHELRLGVKQDAGNKIRVWQELTLVDSNAISEQLKSKTLKDAISEIEAKYGFVLKPQDLQMNFVNEEKIEKSYNLAELIKQNRDNLQAETLGSERSALLFIKILKAMKVAKTQDILKVLKAAENKNILQQLLDIVGYTQTPSAHKAAKSFLNFDNEYDRDNVERYLWAQSVGPDPSENVISDILKMSENTKLPEQITETLILTASAMTNRLVLNRNDNTTDSISRKVKDHISKNLSKCKETPCTVTYLRALKNLKRNDTIPILLDYVRNGKRDVAVVAMQALRALPAEYWSKEVLQQCKKVLYQTEKPYDSSARTLAVDILLEKKPFLYEVEEMLDFLASGDKEFEVRQFLWQSLQMLGEKCDRTKFYIDYMLKKNRHINNYDVLAQKGLSTALSRQVSSNAWSNISIESVQEISGGVLKRGRVDLLIDDAGLNKRVFSLGLFADGLSSMMGGGSSEEESDEPATAGMELNILGVNIRPFKFFSGQGELMGHVWSGTASERTTAFQSLMLIQEERGESVLGTGAIARWLVTAAASVDLAGQVQLSVWSRTAHCVVDKVAGVVIQGSYNADMPFVKSEVKFSLSVEPKLDLESDIDFYDGVKLCVQVKQPDTLVRHNITKVEWIPENKHLMRKSKYKTMRVPGKTYALNRQNNFMCNSIHNKS